MILDNVNKWLTLAANIGILASIIFLATQIEQNNRMMHVQALTANAANHVQLDLAGLPEDPSEILFRYFDGETDFSGQDAITIATWLSANGFQFRNAYRLYELGILSEEDWQTELGLIVGYYGTPWGLTDWQSAKRFYDPAYIAVVEEALSARGMLGADYLSDIIDAGDDN